MVSGRIVVVAGVRGHRNESLVDVGRVRVSLDAQAAVAGPVVVLHEDDEDVRYVMCHSRHIGPLCGAERDNR